MNVWATKYIKTLRVVQLATFLLILVSHGTIFAQDAMKIIANGNVGIGTDTPESALHVYRSDGTATVSVTEALVGPSMPFQGVAQGLVRFELSDEASGERWRFTNAGSKFAINNVSANSPGTEMSVFKTGNMTIGGVLTENSDVNSKQDIVPVNGRNILEKLANLEISEWSYKDTPADRHVGPMAQDFHASFGLGHTDKGIATLDSSGVALAAIKALIDENASLKQRLEQLESQQLQMQAVMARMIEGQQAQTVLTSAVLN
jgi:hypothetical protein